MRSHDISFLNIYSTLIHYSINKLCNITRKGNTTHDMSGIYMLHIETVTFVNISGNINLVTGGGIHDI